MAAPNDISINLQITGNPEDAQFTGSDTATPSSVPVSGSGVEGGYSSTRDLDGDGVADVVETSTAGDGRFDRVDIDSNGDGYADEFVTDPGQTGKWNPVPDFTDPAETPDAARRQLPTLSISDRNPISVSLFRKVIRYSHFGADI